MSYGAEKKDGGYFRYFFFPMPLRILDLDWGSGMVFLGKEERDRYSFSSFLRRY